MDYRKPSNLSPVFLLAKSPSSAPDSGAKVPWLTQANPLFNADGHNVQGRHMT